MNALAAHGAAQAATRPEYIVVNDGKPVESVEKKNKAQAYGKIAAMVLVPLVIGVIIGQISSSAKVYNRTIDDAGKIHDDVQVVGKSLIGIQQALQVGKERGPGGNAFLVNDAKLTADLEALPVVQPDIGVAYHSFLYELDPALVEEVLSFYQETEQLTKALADHIEKAKNDEKIIKEGMVRLKGFNPYQYAAMVEIPKDEEGNASPFAVAKLVQIGTPVCQGQTQPSESGCDGPPGGFRYRLSETGNWGTKKVAEINGETITTSTLVMLDPSTQVLQNLIQGGKASVAAEAYVTRITKLEEKVNELIERRKYIETRLNNKANEGHKFTFFM